MMRTLAIIGISSLLVLSLGDIRQSLTDAPDAFIYQGSIIVRMIGIFLMGTMLFNLKKVSATQQLYWVALLLVSILAVVTASINFYFPKLESNSYPTMDILLIVGVLSTVPTLLIYKLVPMVAMTLVGYLSILRYGLVISKDAIWVVPMEYTTALVAGSVVAVYILKNRYEMYVLMNSAVEAKDELERTLSRVQVLSGMLPICANCKKIRDDQGYYQQIEHYITEHSEAEFTHGICPDCAQLLYPDIVDSRA